MFEKKHRPFFDNKICDVCKKPAKIFRVIENKTYMLCDYRECDFVIRIKHGWHKPIIER